MGRPRPELAALVLAAGAGRRLRPLSELRPKPLCPVGNVALLDLALRRVHAAGASEVAVNLCHGAAALDAHLDRSGWTAVHRSFEAPALGTAGAVGRLRAWLDGRHLLIVNADTWCPSPLDRVVDAWDGRRVAVAVSGPPPLHARSGIVASILPWAEARQVAAEPAGLWERVWRDSLAAGALQSIGVAGPFVDCGTPRDYLRANLAALDVASALGSVEGGAGRLHDGSLVGAGAELGEGASVRRCVIGAGARIHGRLRRCVIWPGATVAAGEDLSGAVRTDTGLTVSG